MINWTNDACEHATIEDIIAATGCSLSTAKRWKKNHKTMPESARRCVRYRVRLELAEIWGKDWQHFKFIRGELVAPGWRRGFNPFDIQAMFFKVQLVRVLQSEARQLKRDLEREKARCEVLERDNDFYRRQVSLESRFGLMLQRVFA